MPRGTFRFFVAVVSTVDAGAAAVVSAAAVRAWVDDVSRTSATVDWEEEEEEEEEEESRRGLLLELL